MNKWNFPNSNGIGLYGASDGGVETFKGDLMSSLTREICQNSLDAVKTKGEIVRIKFTKNKIKTDTIPDIEALTSVFESGYKYWSELNYRKAKEFFLNGTNELKKYEVNTLIISDYGTKGLTGSAKKKEITPWSSMVTSEGVSNKSRTDG